MAEFAGLEQFARIARKAHHLHEGNTLEAEAAEAVLGFLGVASTMSQRNANFLMETLTNANASSNSKRVERIRRAADRLRAQGNTASVREAA